MDWLYYCWLVVWNMNFIFPYIGNNHPNWRTHIFQRGRCITNQLWHWFKKAPGTIVLCIINHSYWSYKSTFARKSVWKAWNGRSTQSLRSISELEAQHLPGRSASKKKGDPMGCPLGYPPNVIFLKDLWKNTEKWSGWWFQTWILLFHFIYGMSSETHWRTHIFQDGYCTTNQWW